MDEYDCGTSYFCTLTTGERPICGSVLMTKSNGYKADEGFDWERKDDGEYDAWDKWSKGRDVLSYGKCNKWSKGNE